jgi:hypothetical protein
LHVVIGRGAKKILRVSDLLHGTQLHEPVERAEGVAARE